jgi:hypothetical protein
MVARLREIKEELRRRMHDPIDRVGAWLTRVLAGYYRYFAVPGNTRRLSWFRHQVYRRWRQALGRRSQKGRVLVRHMNALAARWLPVPRILHPYPEQRLRV